jgi:ammonium transporter, Amt family
MKLRSTLAVLGLAGGLLLAAGRASAEPAEPTASLPGPDVSPGDTAWELAAAAPVMLTTPAVAFFYGGLVRQKNVLSTLLQSFFVLAPIGVQWVLWGRLGQRSGSIYPGKAGRP